MARTDRRPTPAFLLVVLLGMTLFASSASAKTRARKPRAAPAVKQNQVPTKSVTLGTWADDRVFIHAGHADGLVEGAKVTLTARRKALATCVVADVSEHHASCIGDVVTEAVRAKFTPVPSEPPPPAKAPLVPSTTSELALGQAALVGSAYTKVAHTKRARLASWRLPVEVWVSERAHLSSHRVPGTHLGRVSAALRDVPLYFDGLTFRARADLSGAFLLPESTRFRPDEPLRPDVWELAIAWRPKDGLFFAEAGRVRIAAAPGAPIVDGAAFGVRFFEDRASVGAYAGLVPDPVRLLPRFDAYAGGAFANGDVELGPVLLRGHTRAGVTASLDLAARAHVEASLAALFGSYVDAVAFARVSDELSSPLTPYLDLAFVEVGVNPLAHMRLGARWRTNASSDVDLGMPSMVPATEFGRHRADAFARYEPFSFIGGGLDVGVIFDPVTGLLRGFVGPELSVPRAFDGAVSLRIALQEELGDARARMLFSSMTLTPAPRTRVDARLYAIEEPAFADARRDVGSALRVDWVLFDYLRLFGDARVQGGLPSLTGHPRATPIGVATEVGVSGSLY